MFLSNNEYRLFFKKLTSIENRSISSSLLRVKSFTVKRDLLTRAVSSFDVLGLPPSIENGDIVGMYDSFGTIVYLGVIQTFKGSTIEAGQIYSIFDDKWLYKRTSINNIEGAIQEILQTDFQNSNDTLLNSIFDCFAITTSSTTNLKLQEQEDKYVVEFDSFLYDVYEKYGILLNFNIPFEQVNPSINIGIPSYPKLTISNNTSIFRNFTITKNVFETNKLVVYSNEGVYRGTWFATTSGITDNPSALNRIPKINTNIVFSDDDINIIKASNLRNQIYNHEITVELVDNNKLLNFDNLKLGQEADIYYNDNFYNSILTGYTIQMDNGIPTGIVEMKFGLVRLSLTSRLFKRLAKYGS